MKEGFNCSQSVLSVFCEDFGLPLETATRLMQGFGGGIAGTAGMCGALTGAITVIGLKHGKIRADDQAAKDTVNALVKNLFERFRRRHGSLLCRDLLGCDISTREGAALAKNDARFADLCPLLVESAVDILEDIL